MGSKLYFIVGGDFVEDGSEKGDAPYIALAILNGREIVIEYDCVQYGRNFNLNKQTRKVSSIYASPNQSSAVQNNIHAFMKKHKKQVL